MGALFDSMSAGDNVAFPLREHAGLPEEDISRIVSEKLGLVGLAGVQDKKPAQLSGGQRKRVALARAIALNPEVVLYDEPTTGLDPVRAAGINNLIVKLNREMGITSLVVTHDMKSVRTIADRVLMLHRGKFIFDGTVQELDSCEDVVVRRFVEGQADDDSNGA
jgi:phospholipid/cholesterol/gamma-HCH transport system ATP-binding protein